MINIKELRIGNIVYNNLGTRHEPIHNYLLLDSLNYDMRVLDPIPLTEDILLKCGEDNEHLMVDKLGFVIFKNGYPYQFVRDDYKHLHSLQNLYHSLRGEELNVEL